MMQEALKIFSGRSNLGLAHRMSASLGTELGTVKIKDFANGEIYVSYEETVRNADVFVLQTMGEPVNQNFMELCIMVDALKRASAGRINVIMPYYGYSRQEKKDRPREPLSARMIADILTTVGADRVLAFDLHAPAIQGFFSIVLDHLTAYPLFLHYLRQQGIQDGVVIAADAGGVKRAEQLADDLGLPLGVQYKTRTELNQCAGTTFTGDVAGKTPIIIEDIIDTGGSLMNVVDSLVALEARPEIRVVATHGILTRDACTTLQHPSIREVILTDTLEIGPEKRFPRLRILSVAPLLAEIVRNIHVGRSISAAMDSCGPECLTLIE